MYISPQTHCLPLFNRYRYVNGHVFRVVRLEAGEGTLACMSLCRADPTCWSFNFAKTRKRCYLMSTADDEASTRSAPAFSSGYRFCEETDLEWDNEPTDFGYGSPDSPYTPTDVTAAQVAPDALALTWTDAAVATTAAASFNAVCVAEAASCYATPRGVSVKKVGEGGGGEPKAVTGLPAGGTYTCYVQTVVGGSVMGCSAGVTVTLTP